MRRFSWIALRAGVAAATIVLAYAAGDHFRSSVPQAHAVSMGAMDHHHRGVAGVARVAAPVPAPNQVVIDDFAFGPATITVKSGTTVTWVNADDEPHTVVSAADKPLFKSLPLDTGDKFSFVFREPGQYHYFCTLHPRMQGLVVVE